MALSGIKLNGSSSNKITDTSQSGVHTEVIRLTSSEKLKESGLEVSGKIGSSFLEEFLVLIKFGIFPRPLNRSFG
jgi:hypothetical protein